LDIEGGRIARGMEGGDSGSDSEKGARSKNRKLQGSRQ